MKLLLLLSVKKKKTHLVPPITFSLKQRVKEAAGVCPLNMCTSEGLSTKQELMLVSALY